MNIVTRPLTGYYSHLQFNDCVELDENLEATPIKCRDDSFEMVDMELHISDYTDEEEEDVEE